VSYQQHRHSQRRETRKEEEEELSPPRSRCRETRTLFTGRTKKQGKKIAHRSRGKKKEDQRLPPQPVAATPTPP